MQKKVFQKNLGQNKHKSVQVHEATKFRWASTTMTMIDQSSKYITPLVKTPGQNRTFRHAGRIEKSAARLFVFSALLVN